MSMTRLVDTSMNAMLPVSQCIGGSERFGCNSRPQPQSVKARGGFAVRKVGEGREGRTAGGAARRPAPPGWALLNAQILLQERYRARPGVFDRGEIGLLFSFVAIRLRIVLLASESVDCARVVLAVIPLVECLHGRVDGGHTGGDARIL